MRKMLAASALAGALVLGPASVLNAAPAQEDSAEDDDDNGTIGLVGLAGLLGLAGLAGLKRRDRYDRDRYDTRYGSQSTEPR